MMNIEKLLLAILTFLTMAAIGQPALGGDQKRCSQKQLIDTVNSLNDTQRNIIENRLLLFADNTKKSIAILLLNKKGSDDDSSSGKSLPIPEFCSRNNIVVRAYKSNNSVEILYSRDSGIVLSDQMKSQTDHIAKNIIQPMLAEGNYYIGLSRGLYYLQNTIDKEPLEIYRYLWKKWKINSPLKISNNPSVKSHERESGEADIETSGIALTIIADQSFIALFDFRQPSTPDKSGYRILMGRTIQNDGTSDWARLLFDKDGLIQINYSDFFVDAVRGDKKK
jgi:uncharacterized membrane protein YgcG